MTTIPTFEDETYGKSAYLNAGGIGDAIGEPVQSIATLADLLAFEKAVIGQTYLIGGQPWLIVSAGTLVVSPTVQDMTAISGQAISKSLTQDCTFAEDTRTIAFLRSVRGSTDTVLASYADIHYSLNLAQTSLPTYNVSTAGGVSLSPVKGASGTSFKAFGAKGDAVTNDTAAGVKAIAFGGRISVPKGDYVLNLMIDGKQGVVFDGETQANDQNQAVRFIAASSATPVVQFGNGSNIISCGIRNITIDSKADKTYSHLGIGVLFKAYSPSVVWRCFMEHMFIRGFATGVQIDCDINASEAFDNRFVDVETIGCLDYGFKARGVYNTYSKIFSTQCEDYAFFNDGSNSAFTDIVGDGRMAFKGGGQHVTNAVIEAIHKAATSSPLPAFEINGNTSTFRGVRLNGVANTDYAIGVSIFGLNHSIDGLVVQGLQPNQPIKINAGSSGNMREVLVASAAVVPLVPGTALLKTWKFFHMSPSVFTDRDYVFGSNYPQLYASAGGDIIHVDRMRGEVDLTTDLGSSTVRYKRVHTGAIVPANYITASFTDITSTLNTVDKFKGMMVWNSLTKKPVWAQDTAPGSVWVDGTGAVVHTPV